MELEVREFFLDGCKVVKVECLHKGTGSVEEVNGASGLDGLEEFHNVAAERCHTGAAADKDVFDVLRIVLRKEEFAVRSADGHLVARLAGKDVR